MRPQYKYTSPLEKIRQTLLKDPKRAALLAGLAVLMLVLWARVLLSGPASATASLIRRSVAVITDSPQPPLRATASNPVLDWLGQPKRPVQRNLFAIKLDYYGRATDKKTAAQDDPAKSADDGAQGNQQQILLDNLQLQAGKMKLQSTLMGSTPRAMVNGQLVREGDSVEGFVVQKIAPRKITVQQDGVVLEIEMP